MVFVCIINAHMLHGAFFKVKFTFSTGVVHMSYIQSNFVISYKIELFKNFEIMRLFEISGLIYKKKWMGQLTNHLS